MIRWLHSAHCSVPDGDRDRQEQVADGVMVGTGDPALNSLFTRNRGQEVSARDRMISALDLVGGSDVPGGGFGLVGLTRDSRLQAPEVWFAVCVCIRVPATGMREKARFAHLAIGKWEDGDASEHTVIGAAIAASQAAEPGGLSAQYYNLYINSRRRATENKQSAETSLDPLLEYFNRFENNAGAWAVRAREAGFKCMLTGSRPGSDARSVGDLWVGATPSSPILGGFVGAALMIRSLRNDERQLTRNVFYGLSLTGSARTAASGDTKRPSGAGRSHASPPRDSSEVAPIQLRRSADEPQNVARLGAGKVGLLVDGERQLAQWTIGAGLDALDEAAAYEGPLPSGAPTTPRLVLGLEPEVAREPQPPPEITPPLPTLAVGMQDDARARGPAVVRAPEWDALATLRVILALGLSPAGTRESVDPVAVRGHNRRVLPHSGEWVACVAAPADRNSAHQLIVMRASGSRVEYCRLPCWLHVGTRPTVRPSRLHPFGECLLQSLPPRVEYLADGAFVWSSEDPLRQTVLGDLWAALDEDTAPGRAGEVDTPRAVRDGVTLLLMNRGVERRLYSLLGDRPDESRTPYARCILPDFRPETSRRFRDPIVGVNIALEEHELLDTIDRARKHPLDRFLLASPVHLNARTNPVPDRDYDTQPMVSERLSNPFAYRGSLSQGWNAEDLRTGVLESLTLPPDATGEVTRLDVVWYRYSGACP